MQKKISMNKQEIAKGLSQFVMMAFIDPQNIETDFSYITIPTMPIQYRYGISG